MWFLHFLPDSFLIYVVNCVLVAGVVGTFLSFFVINRLLRWWPGMAAYYHILQIVSIILLVVGVYCSGGLYTEMEWRNRVAEEQAKVAVAEEKAADANKALAKKGKEKVKVVKEVQVVIKERIREVEKRIDADCKVDPEAISIINDAAKNVKGKK